MSSLAVIVLTLNEEKHIARCLRNVRQIAREVFVVDSFSSDGTLAMAKALGAQVYQHEFKNHSEQLAWALENLPINAEWVMRIDADEVVSSALAEKISEVVSSTGTGVNGFLFYRQVCFEGELIRYGGVSHWVFRLWRKGTAEVEHRWMDEHIVLKSGNAKCLPGEFLDHNLNNIAWWTDKHNAYSTREAIDLLNYKHGFLPASPGNGTLTPQAGQMRWLKEHLYVRLPLGVRAFLYFGYRMIIRRGILDGRGGFAFHFLQGCWYRFLVDVKVRAVERRMRADGIDCVEAIRREFGVNPLP